MKDQRKHRIGVITMHYPNCGSVLQAYATQKKLESMGYAAEIIDYKYPTQWHADRRGGERPQARKRDSGWGVSRLFARLARSIRKRLPKCRRPLSGKELKYEFIAKELNLSESQYVSREELLEHPPVYDLYLTGSDQVWNPRFAVGDTVFMCGFAPAGRPRVSFSSSFAACSIPAEFEPAYREWLSKYHAISVREESGVKLVKELTGMDAELVCDPTLVLKRSEWDELADQSNLEFSQPYILTYIPTYAYDPYPHIERLIADLKRQTGLKIVNMTDAGELRADFEWSGPASAGPNEFVRLFRDAELVLTTSFHGTAFSLLYEKDFYSFIEGVDKADSRMLNLLRRVGAEDRAIPVTAPELAFRKVEYPAIRDKLGEFRQSSESYLKAALASALAKT